MSSSKGDFESGKFSTSKKKFFLQNCKNWNILQRCKIFFFSKKCHPSRGILKVENFPLQKKNFFLQNCKNWNILQRCKIFFLSKKCHPSRGILKVENFPLQQKKFFFCRIARIGTFCRGNFFPKNRKFFHFFQKLKNSANLFIRAYSWTKFQRKIFSQKMGIQVTGF